MYGIVVRMNEMLRWGVYAGLFAVLFIPFIVANDFFFPFITGKNFTFRIIVEIVFALWIVLALRDPSVRPKKSALLYALGAFLVWLGVATVLAENPSKAFWSNFERMEGYISLLHFGAYFLVLTSVMKTEELWRRFFTTSIVASVLLSLYGVTQLMGWTTINQGGVRVDATFGNATYLAVYMLFHVFLSLFVLLKWTKARWAQLLLLVALVLQVAMIIYAGTRGTLLGLVGGLLVTGLIMVFLSKEQPHLRRIGAGIAVALVVVAGAFFLVKDTSFVRENDILTRIASISLAEGTTRFTIWSMALEGFKERPIFGWGQEGFNYVFNKYYRPSLYGQEPWFDRAHNIFFDWLIAGGLPALVLYLSFFGIALWYLWRKGTTFSMVERAVVTGLLAGYACHNLFVFDNLMSYVMFFSVLGYLTARTTEQAPTIGKDTNLSPGVSSGVAGVVLVALVFVLYGAHVPGIARANNLIDALKPQEGGISSNFESFKKTIGPSGLGRQEAHEQLLYFASQIRNPNLLSLSTEEVRNDIALYAREVFQQEVDRTPNDARLQVFYGSFLRAIGDTAGAAATLDRAHELSPTKQTIYFERAALAFDRGDGARGLALFKEAFELEPEYDTARVYYAATLLRAGQTAAADQLLLERFETTTPPELILFQAYIDTRNFERIVETARAFVAQDPTNFQYQLQLAGAYLEAGRRGEAVEALREAMRLNPEFAEQGQAYIEDIQAGRPLQ